MVALLSVAILAFGPALAQHVGAEHQSAAAYESPAHAHEPTGQPGPRWEGSPEGKAYSEFNHHLAGVFVLLIGLTELREALVVARLAWTRFLLPLAMLGAGSFLIIWSDHEAWPIGSLSFAQTFFGSDPEILQHKLYGLLLLGIGAIELLRRTGRAGQVVWQVPLPALAIIGGLMLFLHSHGTHPAAHKIAIHHAVMGSLAISAGTCKLVSAWPLRFVPAAASAGPSAALGVPVGHSLGRLHSADWRPVVDLF